MTIRSALSRFAAGAFAATIAFSVMTFAGVATHAQSIHAIAAVVR